MTHHQYCSAFKNRHPSAETAAMELSLDSDGELGSDALNSSQSQSSISSCERCSSLSRLSFESTAVPPPPPPERKGATLPPRPHRSSDAAWVAIRAAEGAAAQLGPRDFKLVRRIGSGDVGTVYLCHLRGAAAECEYAMKVVDKAVLAKKKKLGRAETERRILSRLDHPFLPTLYADFDAAPNYSCVVIDYCAGGDLHSLRHRQPRRRFPVAAARFYAAEVLVALEYLHLHGIVYRDLKPENVLIRSDGHIMLSDFDLSLESAAHPSVQLDDSAAAAAPPSCFRPRVRPARRLFVAEPVGARSSSFVGTHEYVSPEVAAGGPHGSAVDWWAFGVLLYELLYGRTPFAGPTNEATLRSIVRCPVEFPAPSPRPGSPESAARGLVAALLAKDPAARLGARRGAADVKAHPFFKGVNLALMRSCRPPVVPVEPNRKPARFDYF